MATAHLAFHCCGFLFVCFLISELETQHLLSLYSSFSKFLSHFSPFLPPCSPPYGPSIQFMALVYGIWHHQTRRPSRLCSYKASLSGAHCLQAISFPELPSPRTFLKCSAKDTRKTYNLLTRDVLSSLFTLLNVFCHCPIFYSTNQTCWYCRYYFIPLTFHPNLLEGRGHEL